MVFSKWSLNIVLGGVRDSFCVRGRDGKLGWRWFGVAHGSKIGSVAWIRPVAALHTRICMNGSMQLKRGRPSTSEL